MIHLDMHERSLRFPLTSNPFPLPNLSLFSLHDKEVCKIYSSIRDNSGLCKDSQGEGLVSVECALDGEENVPAELFRGQRDPRSENADNQKRSQ